AVGQPCDVPARARQGRDEPEPNRIVTTGNHDDGDRLGGVLGCCGCWQRLRYDDVHLEPDQLCREVGQPVELTLRISIVDDNILTLNPPALTQPLPERVEEGRHIGRGPPPKKTYPRHLPRRLRLGDERRGEKGETARDERSPIHHWMTSSARASTEGGIV